MKNPFKRQPNEIDRQIAALNDIAATMREAAETVAIETSAPRLRQKLMELDPRLLDLLIDQSRYEAILGGNDMAAGSRRRAVEACRYAMRDVQIKAAIHTWTDWGFGRTLDITAIDSRADVEWQECWGAPRNRPLFGQAVVHELSRDILRDGEVFFVGYASRQDGTTTWRSFDTLAVTDIIHARDDASINLWYIVTLGDKQMAIPDAFAFFALRDRFEHVALPEGVADINTTATATENGGTFTVIIPALRNRDADGRGWPEFNDALPWSKVYAQMLREYSAVFSAVAMWVHKFKAEGGSRTIDDVISHFQSSLATGAGSYYDTNPRAAAGSMLAVNGAADVSTMPLGSAAGDAQAGTGILALQLSAGLGVKASDVGRVDMFQNKATADEAAKGPQQRWQRYQVFWTSVWGNIVETTLRLVELFTPQRFSSYESRLSTSLPMDIETSDVATAMDAVNKAATAMTLDAGTAMRANTAFLALLLNDLGVEDVDDILNPPTSAEAADTQPILLGESHTPVTVRHVCPLCGFGEAYSYAGHGSLLVCAGCGKTYDPEEGAELAQMLKNAGMKWYKPTESERFATLDFVDVDPEVE